MIRSHYWEATVSDDFADPRNWEPPEGECTSPTDES